MRALPAESEAAFQIKVVNYALYNGWRCYHPPDNRPIKATSGRVYVQSVAAGYPDLTLAHAEQQRLVFAELKTEKGRPTAEQMEWATDLAEIATAINGYTAAGSDALAGLSGQPLKVPSVEVYLWRPSHWETIETTLRRR